MQLVDVVPLANIARPNPQTFTYYYRDALARFSLVEVAIGKRKYAALVIASRNIKSQKAEVRKADFLLRPLLRVIHSDAVLFEWQFALASWMSEYYWFSLGVIVKKFIPSSLLVTRRPLTYSLNSPVFPSPQILILVPDTSFFEGEKRKHLLSLLKTKRSKALFVSSRLTPKRQLEVMKGIAAGERSLVVGTRASLFLPFLRLQKIFVVEELDRNHASWDQKPKFHDVRVAKQMALLTGARLSFYSTLPSLESFFEHIPFSPLTFRKRTKPDLCLIDLTKEVQRGPLSGEVVAFLKDHLLAKKAVILYINRRGEARFLLCRDCGFVPRCDNCDTPFVYHRKSSPILLCHHCGAHLIPPSVCANCGSYEVRYYGFGSERVQKELKALFPLSRVYRLDSDIISKERTKDDVVKAFEQDGNFLVATSMMFQTNLSPVSGLIAVSAESEINIPHFDAYERLFFTFSRLRSYARHTMLIQTYNPEDPLFVFLCKDEWKSFYQEELKTRKRFFYPPFSRIVILSYAHKDRTLAAKEAAILFKKMRRQLTFLFAHKMWKEGDAKILGPSSAFLFKEKGTYHYQIAIKMRPMSIAKQSKLLAIVPTSWNIEVDMVT